MRPFIQRIAPLVALLKAPATRGQIMALSEVAPADVHAYREAVGLGPDAEADFVTSGSGGFRGEDDLRTDQARMLVAWARDQRAPVTAAGDFNFDWDMYTKRGNPGFDAMVADEVWTWIQPDPLRDTNWAASRDNPKRDRFPDSILDFVFVAQAAKGWQGTSEVIVRPGDFPDDEQGSDHRPIVATFRPTGP
ncbi:MAG: hypothetical protein ACKOCX_09525 [Planctomycetota bacterium]